MSKYQVTYIGRIPLSLKVWCDAHAHMVAEVDSDHDYNQGSGKNQDFCYDVLLRKGWCAYEDAGVHTIIEGTVKETLRELRAIGKCECEQCVVGR